MRRVMLVVAVLALAVSGCTTVRVNPLYHELSYQLTPALDTEMSVDKTIAVVPFDDGRMYDDANIATSDSVLLNWLPLVPYTVGHDTHPEVTHNTSEGGCSNSIKVAGTLADAMPKLLADYLHRARRFSKAVYVEAAEVKGPHHYDYVLRGTLVESKLETTRYSYCLGPAALVPYLLGLPTTRYSASLTVEWQLYDMSGKPVGNKRTSSVETPVVHYAGLYYGTLSNHKNAPFGLYIEAARTANEKIATGVCELVAE